MNEIRVFENEKFGKLRGMLLNNEPWFVGKDVAVALGYTNPQKAIRVHVDEDDKGMNEMDTPGGKQQLLFINESGLYSLILSSKLEEAKKYKHWVTSEVLPSIRETGGYITGQETMNEDELIDRALEVVHRRLAKREQELAAANDRILELEEENKDLRPKANYCEEILTCINPVETRIIAKDYGWSAQRLNKYLHDKDIQYKQGQTWLIKQKYADKGYTQSKTSFHYDYFGQKVADIHTYWTQQGRLFIYNLLKADGYLPIIEQDDDYEDDIDW